METDSSPPWITVNFTLAGDDFDADACSAAIGLAPTSTWGQTRPWLRDRPDLDNMNWSFGLEKVTEYSINAVIDRVLESVWPRREAIKEFAREKGLAVLLTCNVTIHQDRPLYELSPSVMHKLADLDASFSLDIFDYSDEQE